MPTALLDPAFRPTVSSNLVRLGDDFDGGYVVDKASITSADTLIALGIGDSWGFEAECLDMHPVPLEAYDASVGPGWFIKEFARSLVVFFNVKFVRRRFQLLTGYFSFFTENRRHHREMVGADPGMVTLAEVLKRHGVGPDRKAFLKIDIEGSEYGILDTLVAEAPHLTGLAIEFHDLPDHLDAIRAFIGDFELGVTHVHCNNCAPLAADGTPEVIELTFTRGKQAPADPPPLPGPLDMPCCKQKPDYPIAFR